MKIHNKFLKTILNSSSNYSTAYIVKMDISLKNQICSCEPPLAHTSNPSYAEKEARSSKSARANSSGDPISKKHFIKKGWWSGSRCRL
jgi:hypothetical protein